MTTESLPSMQELQESSHGTGHDYATGSPHLQHAELNSWMRDVLNRVVNEIADRHGRAVRVLEVGAGHGPFTQTWPRRAPRRWSPR